MPPHVIYAVLGSNSGATVNSVYLCAHVPVCSNNKGEIMNLRGSWGIKEEWDS